MGFKAKARKHRKDNPNTDVDRRKKSNKGDLACAINNCDKFADKSLGGRSLSMDNALDMWGQGNFTPSKEEHVYVNHVTGHGKRKIKMTIPTSFSFTFT